MSAALFRPICLLCAALAAPLSHADNPSAPSLPSGEDPFIAEMPVVLSVSHLAQPLSEAPGAVTVIDSEAIRLSGARDIVDLFRLVPGFQVGIGGSSSRLYYHGSIDEFGQHMQVLIDGRSVYSPYLVGGIDWNNVPLALEDIDRIEAIRGSDSASYGANAFLGVINIVTKHPSLTPGWTASQTSGGQGINDSLVRYGGRLNDVDYRLTAAHRSDNGAKNTPSARDVRLFNFRADWRSTAGDEFQIQAGGTDSSGWVGRPDMNGDQPRERGSVSDFFLARWQRNLAPDEELKVLFHHTDERFIDSFPYPDPGIPNLPLNITIEFSGTASRDSLEAQHTFSPGKDLRLVYGGELRRDTVTSHALFAQSDSLSMNLARLFGNLEWRISPAWLLNVGANLEKDSLVAASTSPRAAINWHFLPDQTLRAGVSTATRAPSIFEMHADEAYYLQGVPIQERVRARGNLQPEDIQSREIGYLGNFRNIGLTADLRLFQERLSSLITKTSVYANPLTVVPPVFAGLPPAALLYIESLYGLGPFNRPNDFENTSRMRLQGAEYQLRYRPREGTQILFTQSFIHTSDRFPERRQDLYNVAPTHSTSLALFQKLPGNLDLSLMLYSVGSMYWSGSPTPLAAPGYKRADLRLAYPFRMGRTRGELAVTAQNLGGDYAETDPYYVNSRRIFTNLRLDF